MHLGWKAMETVDLSCSPIFESEERQQQSIESGLALRVAWSSVRNSIGSIRSLG